MPHQTVNTGNSQQNAGDRGQSNITGGGSLNAGDVTQVTNGVGSSSSAPATESSTTSEQPETVAGKSRDTAIREQADRRNAFDTQAAQRERAKNAGKSTNRGSGKVVGMFSGQAYESPAATEQNEENTPQQKEPRDPFDRRGYLDQPNGEIVEHDAPDLSVDDVMSINAPIAKAPKVDVPKKKGGLGQDILKTKAATSEEYKRVDEPRKAEQPKPFDRVRKNPNPEKAWWAPNVEQGELRGSTYKDFRDADDSEYHVDNRYPSERFDPFTAARNIPSNVIGKLTTDEIIDSIADVIDTEIEQTNAENYPRLRPSTTEEYLEKDENGRYVNDVDIRKEHAHNLRNQQEAMIQQQLNPYRVKFEGETFEEVLDEDGNGTGAYIRTLPPGVVRWMDEVGSMYGFGYDDVVRLMMLRASVGIDSNGEIVKEDANRFHFTEDEAIQTCYEIMESQRRFGHPLGNLQNSTLVIGGTRCFPQGYIPRHMAEKILAGNKEAYQRWRTPSMLNRAIHKEWIEKTQPAIEANTRGDKVKQRYAIENMMRATLALDGADTKAYNISDLMDRSVWDFMEETSQMKQVTKDGNLIDAQTAKQELLEKNKEKIKKRYMREVPIKDKNGDVTGTEWVPKNDNFIMNGMNMLASIMRINGVALNIPLIATSYVEHMTGNIGSRIGNSILNQTLGSSTKGDYRLTKYLREMTRTNEAKEAITVAKTLDNIGGMQALMAFAASGQPVTKEAAFQFINEYIDGKPDKDKPSLRRKLDSWVKYLLPGDMFMEGMDAARILEMTLYNFGTTASGTSVTDNGGFLNTEMLEEAVRRDGIGRAMMDIFATTAGADAYIASTNLNLGRHSGWTYAVQKVLYANGVTNLAITLGLDTYALYGVNAIQNIMPLTNTFSYLTTRGVTRAVAMKNGASFNDIIDSEARYNQLGGNDQFLEGLKKNFIYDCMKLGNFGTIALFGFGVITLLGGIGDPPDGADIFDWLEYRIGGNDEDTESGDRFIPAYWMNDLSGWGLPGAMALAVHIKHNDPIRTWGVFESGLHSMTEGGSVFDMIELINKAPENVKNLVSTMGSDVWRAPEDLQSWVVMEAEHEGAQFLKKMTPWFLNGVRRDTILRLDRNARDSATSRIYDTEHYDLETAIAEDRTVSEKDPAELRRRSDSVNNILYGAFLNFSRHITDGDNFTGYQWWQMPVGTMDDPYRIATASQWDFSEQDPSYQALSEDEKKDFKALLAERTLHDLEMEYGDPVQFVANGGFLSVDARINLKEYCYDQIMAERQKFIDDTNAGMYPEFIQSVEAQARRDQRISKLYDIIGKWCDNEDIPWRDAGYEKLLTDYKTTYEWPDGTPAMYHDWLFDTSGSVREVILPRGNHPTAMLPFTTVDKTDRGYNAETKVNWYKEGITDVSKVAANIEAMKQAGTDVIPYGRDEGKHVGDVIFGGQGGQAGLYDGDQQLNISTEDGIPTIDYRSYVPATGSLPDRIKNMTLDDWAKEKGVDLDAIKDEEDGLFNNKNSKGGSGYRSRSYSGGGGGSSYNPKIYSSSHNVNADRAQGVSVRQPYGATKTYLRPDFETKGSRDAYKRSDF